MSIQALSDFTFYSKYSLHDPETGKIESWSEAVKRIMDMHRTKYADKIIKNPEVEDYIKFAELNYLKKRTLGAQRALQYGGAPTLKNNARLFNCTGTIVDKPKVFQDIVFVLLAGCGAGYSIQKHHIEKLPRINKPTKSVKTYQVPDTCEGWADALGVLLSSYFVEGGQFPEYQDHIVQFDFSKIRPKGALVAGRFKAPGPDPLRFGLEKIRKILDRCSESGNLRPIDCHDIICHAADFVISAGLRRSALICLFSPDDEEMAAAKTGNWFEENPQRGRANNSAVIQRNKISYEDYLKTMNNVKQFGEPGVYFVEDDRFVSTNPCCEIGFWPVLPSGETGMSFCNLVEINGAYCDTAEKFLQQCKSAAILGTLQAGYTDFPYLGKVTEDIAKYESLLGCSMTGWMCNPELLFNDELLQAGVEIIKNVNQDLAALLDIRPAARLTCSKPSGTTSALLGTSSGVHPHHAKRYIRRVQLNKQEDALAYFEQHNPGAVEESVWSANGTDKVCSFLCEVPKGSIVKNQISAIEFLEKIKFLQQNWVIPGTIPDRGLNAGITHNISNTVTVKEDEWDAVLRYIYDNREYFSGLSLLAASGDLDYTQAPFTTVLTPLELAKEYGDASVFASGMITDALYAFDNNLWKACDSAIGRGAPLEVVEEPEYPKSRNYKELAEYFLQKERYDSFFKKKDWTRRFVQFAERYFEGDQMKTARCLKSVSIWKTWCDLQRTYVEIDWSKFNPKPSYAEASSLAGIACSGGACEIV
jgi:ribonucleoside-triphosphate reductase (thioredoxin)